MNTLAWALAAAAIAFQSISIGLAVRGLRHGEATSQIVVIPCLLWYIGLMLRSEGFFLPSRIAEMAVVVGVHASIALVLSTASTVRKNRSRR